MRTWIYAGFTFKVERVDDVIRSIVDAIVKDTSCNHPQEHRALLEPLKIVIQHSTCNPSIFRSVDDGENNNNLKGRIICIKNFSGHHLLSVVP